MVAEIDRKSSGKTVRSKNKEKFGVPTMSHKIRNDNTENVVQTSKDSPGGVNFITFQHRERAPLTPEPTGASKASTAQRETSVRLNPEPTGASKASTAQRETSVRETSKRENTETTVQTELEEIKQFLVLIEDDHAEGSEREELTQCLAIVHAEHAMSERERGALHALSCVSMGVNTHTDNTPTASQRRRIRRKQNAEGRQEITVPQQSVEVCHAEKTKEKLTVPTHSAEDAALTKDPGGEDTMQQPAMIIQHAEMNAGLTAILGSHEKSEAMIPASHEQSEVGIFLQRLILQGIITDAHATYLLDIYPCETPGDLELITAQELSWDYPEGMWRTGGSPGPLNTNQTNIFLCSVVKYLRTSC